MGSLYVSGHPVQPPSASVPDSVHFDGGRIRRPVAAQAPCCGSLTPGDAGQVFLALRGTAEARDRIGDRVARDERPGVEGTAKLLGEDYEVDEWLLGHAAALEFWRHQHCGPPELGTSSPQRRVEDFHLLDHPPYVANRLVLVEEPARRATQQFLILAEPEVHRVALPSLVSAQMLRSARAQYSSRKSRL